MDNPVEWLDAAAPAPVGPPGAHQQGAERPRHAGGTWDRLGAWHWLPVRQLHARHRPRLVQHLLSLSAADRRLRFGHVPSDDQISHYVEQLDFSRDQVFGVFNHQLHLVAMAHLAFEPNSPVAEFGVSVQPHLRGRGIGARLFERAVTQARNRGASRMAIHIARDNTAMLAIVRRAGAQVAFDGSEATAQLDLPGYTLGTQMEALMEGQAAEIDYGIKMQVLRLDRLWPRLLLAEDGPQEPLQS